MASADDQQQEKISLKEKLKVDHLGFRLLIGLLLTFFLALFLHFREERVEVLELDTRAKSYVVAQIDFEFPDDESTIIVRQDAMRVVGSIYKLEEKQIDTRTAKLETQVAAAQDQLNHEEVYAAIRDVERAMSKARFADNRTLQKIRELDLSTKNYYLTPSAPSARGSVLSDAFWRELSSRVLANKTINENAVRYVIGEYKREAWKLEEDARDQRQLRQLVGETIEPRFSKVRAGNRIIDQGEKVTMRHITMMQAMKKALTEKRNLWRALPMISSFIFAFILVALGTIYFRLFCRKIYDSLQKLAIFATVFIITLAVSKAAEYFLLETSHHLIEIVRYPLFVPFAAILICILVDHHVALFSVTFLSVLLGVSLAVEHDRFLVLNLVTGIVAIIATRDVRKRKEVFAVCGKVWLSCLPVLMAFSFARNIYWDVPLAADILSTLAFMVITAVFVVGFLPILESIFRVMTDITLVEYMDPNNELLRRLSIEARGTYDHSLRVGTLAEGAAQAIGANGLFCRVASYYHDVGKLFNPHYFTENQMGGFNIHQLLTPLESAQVIMAHVPEGEALAKQHNLPKSFIDIIHEHHGTTLVYFFYSKQIEQMDKNVDVVDPKQFRYKGPKPRTKESAIIMIADSSEAASRALKEHDEESITELVERIVADKAKEKQFDDCQLTFEELGIVKQKIIDILVIWGGVRPVYPEKNL